MPITLRQLVSHTVLIKADEDIKLASIESDDMELIKTSLAQTIKYRYE